MAESSAVRVLHQLRLRPESLPRPLQNLKNGIEIKGPHRLNLFVDDPDSECPVPSPFYEGPKLIFFVYLSKQVFSIWFTGNDHLHLAHPMPISRR